MSFEVAFTPSGHIAVVESTGEDGKCPDAEAEAGSRLKKAAKAFEAAQGAGLFFLATERFDGPLPVSFVFWRDFAARYLMALCHTPESAGAELDAIPPPEAGDLDALLLDVPPIQGAEYLNRTSLAGVWEDLDAWTRGEVAAGGEGLAGFLKRRAPLWHQVGRVCFHLAENSRNPGLPVRLHGDIRARRRGRRPGAVSAAQPRPARTGRGEEQEGIDPSAFAGPVGVREKSAGQGVA